MANPFEILGVARNASEAEIKSAFRTKAKECHPDTHPNDAAATAKFAELSDAYDKLKDGKAATWQDDAHRGPHGFQHDPFGNMHGFNMNDIFAHMDQARRRARKQNDDIEVIHHMTLEECFSGKKVTIPLNIMSGHTIVDVTIPPGVEHGQRIRVANAGHDHDRTLPRGNLVLTAVVIPHSDFERHGLDLLCVREIDLFTALLGGSTEVKTISGSVVDVTIPKGVNHGTQLRVAGRGMPLAGTQRVGDMIILLSVQMPKKLSDGQLDLIRQARDLKA